MFKGWHVIDSKIVKEWQAQAEVKGKREMLLRLLRRRFPSLPEEVVQAVRKCEDAAHLDGRGDALITASTLAEFRQEIGA